MALQQADLIRVHQACGKMMQPMNILSNPEISHFYCSGCHVSEDMPMEVVRYLNQKELASKGRE